MEEKLWEVFKNDGNFFVIPFLEVVLYHSVFEGFYNVDSKVFDNIDLKIDKKNENFDVSTDDVGVDVNIKKISI